MISLENIRTKIRASVKLCSEWGASAASLTSLAFAKQTAGTILSFAHIACTERIKT